MQTIGEEEMVIEYIGEVISGKVCERREHMYDKMGIGSSYMFRINKNLVIDATRSGSPSLHPSLPPSLLGLLR
jgi:SET domain-containing protein